MLKRKEPLTQ